MPNLAAVHYHLGMSYAAAGQPEKAAEQFKTAFALEPDGTRAQGKYPCRDEMKRASCRRQDSPIVRDDNIRLLKSAGPVPETVGVPVIGSKMAVPGAREPMLIAVGELSEPAPE